MPGIKFCFPRAVMELDGPVELNSLNEPLVEYTVDDYSANDRQRARVRGSTKGIYGSEASTGYFEWGNLHDGVFQRLSVTMEDTKHKIWRLLSGYRLKNPPLSARVVQNFLLILIIINIVAVVIQTVDEIDQSIHTALLILELVSISIFTLEYFLRLWCCTVDINGKYKEPYIGRLKWMMRPMSIVDMLVIVPFYIGFFMQLTNYPDFRVILMTRIFILLKAESQIAAFHTFGVVIKRKAQQLWMSLFIALFVLIITTTIVYAFEKDQQPEEFANILVSLWWGVACLTSVGYGDITPITPIGKLFGALTALLGIAVFALPTGILAAGFMEELTTNQNNSPQVAKCPKCRHIFVTTTKPATDPDLIQRLTL